MTKAPDIREVIADQASSAVEQQALGHMADALAETLALDVPHRPEFRAELRRRLMAEARRTLSPWYRRPAFVYSALGVAAAAAVLAVGLNLWTPPAAPQQQVAVLPPAAAPSIQAPEAGTTAAPRQVNSLHFPPVVLPEQTLTPDDSGPAAVAGLDLKNVAVYLVSSRPDGAQFSRIARGMDFASTPAAVQGGYRASEGARTLTMSGDGLILYNDPAPAASAEPPVMLDPTAVRAAAQNFLVRASLPVPGLEPQVVEQTTPGQPHAYAVTYTPTVGGLPVVNERTVIRMTDRYRVFAAEAYVQAGQELDGTFPVITPADAIATAQGLGGGTFGQADLAYARTTADGATYLQPVWRVFGIDSGGQRKVRYVSAIAGR